MKRLTVHLANVKKIQLETNKFVYQHKGRTYKDSMEAPKEAKKIKEKKIIIKNTVTARDLKDEKDIMDALSKIRKNHTIAIAERTKGCWKAGQEMYHIANQK